MTSKRKGKNRKQIDRYGADKSAKNSTCSHNVESLDWKTCADGQLEKIIRRKLVDLYREALSIIVFMKNAEDVALKGLLARGYCTGKSDCLANVVINSLEFLRVGSENQEDQPRPFQNLELLVEFNLHFMVYILQKFRPSLNRISACRFLLMNDLNLNKAIPMDVTDTRVVMTEMLCNLNLDDLDADADNLVKDRFLALEIREILYSLDVLDESVSEVMKDMMIADSQKTIDDLDGQLKDRMRWATKRMAQARRKQTTSINLEEEMKLFDNFINSMISMKKSEYSSINNEVEKAEKAINGLEIDKEGIKSAILASKLIQSETKKQCLEFSKGDKKNWVSKNWLKQKMKLREEIALEKNKISKWEKQLVEIEAAIIQAQEKLGEVIEARKVASAQFEMEKRIAADRMVTLKLMAAALNAQLSEEVRSKLEKSILMMDKIMRERAKKSAAKNNDNIQA